MQKTIENHCRRRATPPHPWDTGHLKQGDGKVRNRQVSATSAENITLSTSLEFQRLILYSLFKRTVLNYVDKESSLVPRF